MSNKKKSNIKFEFTTDYQEELIRSLILDPDVRSIFTLIKEAYFTKIEHQLIFIALQKYFKKKKKIPSMVILKEYIVDLCKMNKYAELVLQEDIDNIYKILPKLYEGKPDDSDDIKEKALQFVSYVMARDLNNDFDLTDFSQYEVYSRKFQEILNLKQEHKKDRPKSLVRDIAQRQLKRRSNPDVIPTPFHQVNSSTNANGYAKGSIAVLLDMAKATKTFTLTNVARSYMALRKNVLIIDNENGEEDYLTRLEQSTMNKTKSEILSGDLDDKVRKHLRKYSRLGVDTVVKRVPAMVTSCNDIAEIMEELKRDFNFIPDILIVDSAYKLASNYNIKEDTERISQVYVELGNLALLKGIEHIWTAHHVKRESEKNRSTRYVESDISKCIDITKHAQAIWGLNSTDDEREQGIQRWELVVQRDGPPHARALFYSDVSRQRFKEFTIKQREAYNEVADSMLKEEERKKKDNNKKPRTNGDI